MIGVALAALVAAETSIDIRMRPMPGLPDEGKAIGCMTLVSAHVLSGPRTFGGYSGLAFDAGTGALTLASDRDTILSATLTLSDDGRVEGIGDAVSRPVLSRNRRIVGSDIEAVTADGEGFILSREKLEDLTRVHQEDGAWVSSGRIADLSFVDPLPPNTGFEAMARLPDNRFLLITEALNGQRNAAIAVFDEKGTRRIGFYRPATDYRVTEAAADDRGERLFVIERAFSPAKGPRARITVVAVEDIPARRGRPVPSALLGEMSFTDGADNMEGMAFFRAPDGREHLLLVSDDNFNPLQRTVLMSLRLNEGCPRSAAEAGDGPDEAP